MLLLLLLAVAVESRSSMDLAGLHCSRLATLDGQITDYDDTRQIAKNLSASLLHMGLHETACLTLKLNNSDQSLLHAIEYLRLEQQFPVRAKYTFAIPRITPSCICDCAGGDVHCKMEEYNYKNCTSGPLCYRTYHPSQSSIGCLGDQKSEACCQLKIEPYRGWTFNAIQLSQPNTVIVFRYRIFSRVNSQWHLEVQETFEVPMNKGGERFTLNNGHEIEVQVSGSRPNREVPPGMYFVREGTNELRSNPINEPTESDMGKLGWLRLTNGKWGVPNGPVKMKDKYHLNVENCRDQSYTSTFDGEQYVLLSPNGEESENFNLGHQLSDDPWIKDAKIEDRFVRVEHAEGNNIAVHLTTESRPRILRHSSSFQSFTGIIKLDQESKTILNITLIAAKGTLIVNLYPNEKSNETENVFTIGISSDVKDYQTLMALPSSISSSKYICIYPSGDLEARQCKWIPFEAQKMQTFDSAHKWQFGKGDCYGCNERGLDSVWYSMDPRSWLDGIDSPKEAIAIGIEIVGVGVMLLFLILLCTKCFIPLFRCSIAVAKPIKISA